MNSSEIRQNLEWLFDLNKNKKEFINFILSKDNDWSEAISQSISELNANGALGVQEKFEKSGFNADTAYIKLLPIFCELEVGIFLIKDLIKALESYN